jgi:cell shape-determining protein MreD
LGVHLQRTRHSSRRILLPVSGWFIHFTLVSALVLNLIPFGRLPGIPDWVALVLAITFGFYGLLRKVGALGALEGLTLETLFAKRAQKSAGLKTEESILN